MVQLIVGNRGSGKTKTLIHAVEEAAKVSKGNVICIEKGDALKFGLSHKIRLIDIQGYNVKGADEYYGFIAGLMASNYDITEIFGDATFKIICGKEKDYELMANFVEKVAKLAGEHNVTVHLTVSCDEHDLPERVRGMISK